MGQHKYNPTAIKAKNGELPPKPKKEVISFNRDGFIGFCGAADSENTAPVVAAFVEWCDWLAERRA